MSTFLGMPLEHARFYGTLAQDGLPFLWPLLPLGLAFWGREIWTRTRNTERLPAHAAGLVFFLYYCVFILFFMADLINYFLPLVPVGVLAFVFLTKALAENPVRLGLGLALLLGLFNGWAGYPYGLWIFLASLLVGLLPLVSRSRTLSPRPSWLYALAALWIFSLAWKAQDYLRHPPDPNRVWVAAVLAHPAQTPGQPLLFVGEHTDARALEFYGDYQVEPISQLPAERPAQAILFSLDRRAIFLPALEPAPAAKK
jgi:hypothetical protein